MSRILGIDTSCDDTSVAVVADGTTILANIVASQVDIHHRYGGVVPELACRKHIEAIGPVYRSALDEAGLTLADLDAIAVTQGPGLIGALLVGLIVCQGAGVCLRQTARSREPSRRAYLLGISRISRPGLSLRLPCRLRRPHGSVLL